MKKITIPLIVVLALIGIMYFLSAKPSTPVTNNTTNPFTQTGGKVSKTIDIKITVSGFNPTSVTINKGYTVKFTNNDSSPHWPASNPHPIHTDYPGFDALRPVAPGQSYSFQFERLGKFGFHDHLNPSLGGSVTVQ